MNRLRYALLFFLICGCRENYDSPVSRDAVGLLVVEGFINTGKGATSFTLSRMIPLHERIRKFVTNAVVQVESESNQVYLLAEKNNGVYSADSLPLNDHSKYRLRIKTPDNKVYVSNFEQARRTPPIDSVTWTRDNSGLRISVNSHDATNSTRYYSWDYQQTWEFHSPMSPTLKYTTRPAPGRLLYSVIYIDSISRMEDTSKYRCWQSNGSANIAVGSTTHLTQDVVRQPLIFIQKGSIAISVLYSVLIRQFALSKEEYNFLEIMRKNTEVTGSIFDPQPSKIIGNISCISNADEAVIGWVGVSSVEEKRIFIRNDQLPGWNYNSGCFETAFANHPDSILEALRLNLVPTRIHTEKRANMIDTFYAADQGCIDCTLTGTKNRPAFWP